MSLTRDIAIMRRVPILRRLNEDQLRLLAFGSGSVRLHRGEVLYEPGDPAVDAILVLSGQIELQLPVTRSLKRIAGVGALLEPAALFVEARRVLRAVARSETEILRIPGSQMQRIMDEFPAVAEALHRDLSQSLAAFGRELAALANGGATGP